MSSLPTNFINSPRRKLTRFVLILSGLALVIYGFTRSLDSGTDATLWVIDNSLSMAVTDIATSSGISISRLDRAKQIVASGSFLRSGEQAIMTAAYGAKLELPMTSDRSILSDVVSGITILIRGGGSSVTTPLETIRLIYGNTPHLSIIWITDGEFTDSGATLSGFTTRPDITFIGVGTRSGWPIPLWYDAEWRPRYKESWGSRVNSVRDDSLLTSVADSLDARLIFWDSLQALDLSTLARWTNSSRIPPYLMILWVFVIVSGLMISRFSYWSIATLSERSTNSLGGQQLKNKNFIWK